ncbi:MAG: hypothetical protein DHS20C06_05710 [Hyphobacterium sp.]|nr:MAG: hypothetical protein DHS20C06_05710 [Hyphobacterium sp.]
MNRALPWIVALIISLTANGVMTGLVLHQLVGRPHISDMLHHDRLPMPPPGRGERREGGFNVRAFVQNLPESQRGIARERFDAQRETIRRLMFQARNAQQEAQAAMAATPYDPESVADALNELRATRFEIEELFEGIVLEVVADLPPDQRMRAMQAGRRGPPQGADRRRDSRDGRRPPPDRF